jgi:hypothetical protein
MSEKMDAMKIQKETMDEMETPKRDLERWSLSKIMDDEYTTQAKGKSIKGPYMKRRQKSVDTWKPLLYSLNKMAREILTQDWKSKASP